MGRPRTTPTEPVETEAQVLAHLDDGYHLIMMLEAMQATLLKKVSKEERSIKFFPLQVAVNLKRKGEILEFKDIGGIKHYRRK